MKINLRKIGEFCIIDLPENTFSKENTNNLKDSIHEILEQGVINILLNMENIAKIDGTGLGALLSIQKTVIYNGANIRLYDLQPYVASMIFQTRLNRIFDIIDVKNDLIEEKALLDNLIA